MSSSASQRRQTRLRREYLYRKSLEGPEKKEYEQKRIIRQALAEGRPLPTEVRASYDKLAQEISQEDGKTSTPHSHIDDEYGDAMAGRSCPEALRWSVSQSRFVQQRSVFLQSDQILSEILMPADRESQNCGPDMTFLR